jgi:hypothetical protein
MKHRQLKFSWWYRNISRFLTREEALSMSRKLLDDICDFLDHREYNISKAIKLRHRCWMLCFPLLHNQFSELIKTINSEGHISARPAVERMKKRVQELVADFTRAAKA